MQRTGSRRIIVAAVLAAVAAAAAPGLRREAAPAVTDAKPHVPVSVTTARSARLPLRFTSQGHLTPLNQVQVRPQLAGRIRAVHFREGDDVRAGQLLFTLDADEADAQLERARAQAAQFKAQLHSAERALQRAQGLVGTGHISASALDTLEGAVETLAAQRRAALAEIQAARVQLGRTRIVAPLAARAGAVEVHAGSLTQPGDAAALVSLVQFDPIGVEFTLPEQDLPALLQARAQNAVAVRVAAPGAAAVAGELVFIDNSVSPSSGTIRLRASLPNAARALWPGGFVQVELSAGEDAQATVLPPQAVLEGPQGHFVFVLAAGGTVAMQPVQLRRIQDQLALVGGIADGLQVVVEGNQDLRPGLRVQASAWTPPAAYPPALSAAESRP